LHIPIYDELESWTFVKQSIAVPNDMINQGILVGNPAIRIIGKKKTPYIV
jgi:hypothetical protein